jgi:hypothetical protein
MIKTQGRNLKNIKSALKRQKDKDNMEDTRMYFTLMYQKDKDNMEDTRMCFTLMYWCLEGYGFNLDILVPFQTFRSSNNLTLAPLHARRSLTCLLITSK